MGFFASDDVAGMAAGPGAGAADAAPLNIFARSLTDMLLMIAAGVSAAARKYKTKWPSDERPDRAVAGGAKGR